MCSLENKGGHMPVDLENIPPLNPGVAAEINFVAMKMRELPFPELYKIHTGLHADQKDEKFGWAIKRIFDLIQTASTKELTAFINQQLGEGVNIFDAYVFMNAVDKAILFAKFFFNHLKRIGDGEGYEIGIVNIDTLEVKLEPVDYLLIKFGLDAEEVIKLKAWLTEHDKTCPFANPRNCGAAGGRLSYSFFPCNLGIVTKITCACHETHKVPLEKSQVDVTDYDW